MAAHIVTFKHPTGSGRYFLRSVAWTPDKARARRFPTVEAAEAAIENAQKFCRVDVRPLATIEPE